MPEHTPTPLTKNQWRGFFASWGGWALDGMDSYIFALVMVPALKELLPRSGLRAHTAWSTGRNSRSKKRPACRNAFEWVRPMNPYPTMPIFSACLSAMRI